MSWHLCDPQHLPLGTLWFLRWYHFWYHSFARLFRLTIAGENFGTEFSFPCHHGLSWLNSSAASFINSKIEAPVLITYIGAAGFEPTREGVKVPCLTAWLHSNVNYHKTEVWAPMLYWCRDSKTSSRAVILLWYTHHTGFEPVTFAVTGRRALRCSNGAKFYEWNLLDLNQRPLGLQPSALPSELLTS